ncbi:hypothetical protein ACHWQZ_G009753 [Mnemiopsis leidyi]
MLLFLTVLLLATVSRARSHNQKVREDMGSMKDVDDTPLEANMEDLEEQKGGHTVYRRNQVRTWDHFEVNSKTSSHLLVPKTCKPA